MEPWGIQLRYLALYSQSRVGHSGISCQVWACVRMQVWSSASSLFMDWNGFFRATATREPAVAIDGQRHRQRSKRACWKSYGRWWLMWIMPFEGRLRIHTNPQLEPVSIHSSIVHTNHPLTSSLKMTQPVQQISCAFSNRLDHIFHINCLLNGEEDYYDLKTKIKGNTRTPGPRPWYQPMVSLSSREATTR